MPKHTKIICTLGPASSEKRILLGLFKAGMSIARFNFSHGTHQGHKKHIELTRSINQKYSYHVEILQDLEGYRIRVGHLKKPRVLKKGHPVYLAKEKDVVAQDIPFDYQGDIRKIKNGLRVFIDDGYIVLKVLDHEKKRIKLEVICGGVLKERKGINIPGLELQANVLTKKDEEDLEFGIRHHVDWVAQSFVRNQKDIERIRAIVKTRLPHCKIIAKIENEDGLRNIDTIMKACDGIMIARGDLGISIPVYKIAIIQKDIIRRCNRKKKMVITATQMLESMTEHNRPTRAEVSDVSNAVLDGTDYVMLSGETASGRFPVQCVKTMKQIIDFTESSRNKSVRLSHVGKTGT